MMAYTVIILFLPMAAFELTSIYHSGSTFTIMYDWLNYDFSFLLLPIILIGFLFYLKHFDWRYIVLPIVIFLQDTVRIFYTDINIFELNSYELYLSYLCGLFAAFICFYSLQKNKLKFFHVFWFLNVCTQFIRALFGLSGFEFRFNVVNMDVGGTGIISALALVLILFCTEKKSSFEKILIPVYLVSILLSGSRNALLFLLILYIVRFIRNINDVKLVYKYLVATLAGVICVVPFINKESRIYSIYSEILQFLTTDRSNITYLGHTNSVVGRFNSIMTALNVIQDNPFGVGNGVIIIQSYMQSYGYPTFPHSYLLCGGMMWGIWIWPVFIYLCYKVIRLIKTRSKFEYWGLYLLLTFILAGGPIVNFKSWFCIIFMILIVSQGQKNN
jgi:hypothetical protein